MFLQQVRIFPAAGKQGEVRAILEEGTRARHAAGIRSALVTAIFGDNQGFATAVWHKDLAAFQAFREANHADAGSQDRVQRLNGIQRQPAINELWETVVASPGGPTPRFILAFMIAAAPGNGPAVRAALSDYTNARNKAGRRATLYTSVSGSARFLFSSAYMSLADMEAGRAASAASAESAALGRAGTLFAAPGNTTISEILLANP